MAKKKQTVYVDVEVVGNKEEPIEEFSGTNVYKDVFGETKPIIVGETSNPASGEGIYDTSADGVTEESVRKLYDMVEDELKARQVTFVSDIQGLNLAVEVIRLNIRKEPVRVSKVFEFRRGTLILDDPFEIEALMRHPNYGGEGDNESKSLQPLFWRTRFPTWKIEYLKATMDKRNQPYEEQTHDYSYVLGAG